MSGIGGDIKVTLTLDDNGFSAKTEKASSFIKALNAALQDSGKFADQFEKSISGLSKDMQDFGARFSGLESSLASFTQSITSAVDKIGAVASKAKSASSNIKELSSSFSVGRNNDLKVALDGIGVSMAQLKPSIARAISGIDALGAAQKKGAATAKKAAEDATAAKVAELENEIAINKRLIAERSATYDELNRLATELENRALGARMRADEDLAVAERIMAQGRKAAATSGKDSYIKGATTSSAPYLANAEQAQQEANRLEQNATAARLEALAIGELIQEINRENGERASRIAAIQRDAEALASLTAATNEAAAAEQRFASLPIMTTLREVSAELDKAAEAMHLAAVASLEAGDDFVKQQVAAMGAAKAAETLAAAEERAAEAARVAADQAKQRQAELEAQNAAMQAQAQMLKSLGAAWAAFKIEAGFKSAISAESQMEQQQLQLKALNLSPAAQAEYMQKAFDLSKINPFITALDAVKARMSAISSIGENNTEAIDATLGKAVQVAQNLQAMGLAHGDLQTTIRNLYGVAEARGAIGDTQRTNDTMELMQRIVSTTGGKVQLNDIESAARRDQPFFQGLSDKGIEHLASVIDMMMTAGGGSGGAAGGASTVGMAFRALASYASGAPLSDHAAKQLAEAGVLNLDGLDLNSKHAKKALKELRTVGFQHQDLAQSDPVAFAEKVLPTILAYMQEDKNRAHYFGSADINDPTAQQNALMKFLMPLGIRNTAVTALSVGMNPAMAARADAQQRTIANGASADQVQADRMQQMNGQWAQTQKQLGDLARTVGGDLAPAITGVLTELNKLLAAMNEIAANHPFITQITAATAALVGIKLAIAGVTGVFGGFSKLVTAMVGFGSAAKTAAEGAAAIGAETAGVASFFSAFKLPILTSIGEWILAFGNKFAPMLVSSLGALTNTVVEAFGLMGKAVLRAIPLVGELLIAWDLTKLIGSLEVGGHSIADWFDHWFSGLIDKAKTFVRVFKDTLKGMFTGQGVKWVQSADGSMVPIPDENVIANAKAQTKVERSDADKKWQRDEALYLGRQASEQDPTSDAREMARMGVGAPHTQAPAQPDASSLPSKRVQALLDGDGSGGRKKRTAYEDPYKKSLAELTAAKLNDVDSLASLLTRTPDQDSFLTQAMNEFKAKWAGGDFDIGHDPTKRRWKNADGTLNEQAPEVQAWVQAKAAVEQYAEQKKALVFANERVAASEVTANDALNRLTSGNLTKQTAAFTALEKEMARAEERLQTGTKAFADWHMQKDAALFEQARTDLSTYTADLRSKDKDVNDALDDDEANTKRAKTELKYQRTLKAQEKEYEARQSTADATFASLSFDIQSNSDLTEEAKQARLAQIEQEYYATRQANAQAFVDHMKTLWREYQKDMETPLDEMVKKWKDTDDEIDQQEVAWSNQFMDTFMNFVKTGKFQWQQFVESIGMDVLRDSMQKALADPMKTLFGGLGNLVKNYVTGDATSAANAPLFAIPAGVGALATQGTSALMGFENTMVGPGGAATSGISAAVQQTTSSLTQFESQVAKNVFSLGDQAAKSATETAASAEAATGLQTLASAAQEAAMALQSMSGSGGGGGGGLAGLLGGLFSMGGSSASSLSFSTTGTMTGIGGSGALFGPSAGMDLAAFANGGIMTEFGEVSLRKYADGGIANSPQLALFGEGSMAEAYVPLPDGRSIPVTMKGGSSSSSGAAPNVNVNVINQTGQQVSAQQGNVRWDGRQAILDVVLSAATTPGTFRDNLRGAVS